MKLSSAANKAIQAGYSKYQSEDNVIQNTKLFVEHLSVANSTGWHYSPEVFIGWYSVTEMFPALVKCKKDGCIIGFYKLLK